MLPFQQMNFTLLDWWWMVCVYKNSKWFIWQQSVLYFIFFCLKPKQIKVRKQKTQIYVAYYTWTYIKSVIKDTRDAAGFDFLFGKHHLCDQNNPLLLLQKTKICQHQISNFFASYFYQEKKNKVEHETQNNLPTQIPIRHSLIKMKKRDRKKKLIYLPDSFPIETQLNEYIAIKWNEAFIGGILEQQQTEQQHHYFILGNSVLFPPENFFFVRLGDDSLCLQ